MTIDDVKSYLRVDFDDDDDMIGQIMMAAETYVTDAVGAYDKDNPKANILFMAVVQDLYDNRSLMVTEQQKKRMAYTFASIMLQLQYQAKEDGK